MNVREKEEIRSLKFQRMLAILALIGSALSYAITNSDKIASLFEQDPKIRVFSSERLVHEHATLTMSNLMNHESFFVEIGENSKNNNNWLTIPQGTYDLQVKLNDRSIFDKVIFARNNNDLTIEIPPLFVGNIGVTASLVTTSVLPGSSLDITISSSGRGYAWIFSQENGIYKLLFPVHGSLDIAPESPVQFPLKFNGKDIQITAEETKGSYSLLAIVTSVDKKEFAEKLSLQFNPKITAKAGISHGSPIWGAKELYYKVE